MTNLSIIQSLIADELFWHTNLSDDSIYKIANNVADRLLDKRYTVIPRYLTDDMYDVQQQICPDIPYSIANEMYKEALNEYHRPKQQKTFDDDGYFW